MTPVRRAEWVPTGRRRWHPSDVAALRWGVGCATPVLCVALPYAFLFPGRASFGVGLLAVVAVNLAGVVVLARTFSRPERRRAFADLGERDDDMSEVRIRLYRRGGLLGEDLGYLWLDRGGTAFQGARFAFRLAGGTGKADGLRYVVECEGDVRLVADALGVGVMNIAGKGAPGRVTLPPATRDPELRRPNLVWRTLLVALLAWGLAPHGLEGWAILALASGAIFRAVWLDRRAG